MKAFFPFLVIPLVLFIITGIGQWWSARTLPHVEPITISGMPQLPPDINQLNQPYGPEQIEPLRLEALLPPRVINKRPPIRPLPNHRSTAKRFRLTSILVGEGIQSSAVINDRVLSEGECFDGYCLLRVAKDHAWLSGARGRERIDITRAATSVPTIKHQPSSANVSLPPAPDAAILDLQYRRLLENLSNR